MKPSPSGQLGLFEASSETTARVRGATDWPSQDRFPINLHERSVQKTLLDDVAASDSLLVITGFSSLEHLVTNIGGAFGQGREAPLDIRILFGSEPDGDPASFGAKGRPLPDEMRDYWLERGISIDNAPELLDTIEHIRLGHVQARHIRDPRKRLHAKIYVCDEAVITGSSNFSQAGMRIQHEFNCRFSRKRDPARYEDTRRAAENFWRMGDDFTEEFLELLESLLRVVSFEEAVARASAELLEGEWTRRFLPDSDSGMRIPLWPSQIQGIGRALWIIDHQGSCLIADATGAGKTRMGAHLLKSVVNRMLGRGRLRNDQTVLICPPGDVERAWDVERARCGLNLVTHSHGLLSRSEAENHAVISHDVRRAQCIAIDEAHNFLNPKSSRTRSLLGNMADHVVLFTATPINKGVRDLISIVELLGADNLDDEALKLFDELALRMRRQRNQFVLRDDERRRLRAIVGRFTLRRTKRDLKLQAQRHPEAFVDDDNQPCTYPEHVAHTYETRETVEDQELAEQIRELAGRLKGMVNLGKGIEFPESLRGMASPEKFVSARLKSAAALAYYHVMSALRSSRPALVEHILGTDEACRRFGLDASLKPTPTGNILRSLDGIIGQVHPSNVAELLPAWLLDKQAHAAAVREEIEIYEQILARVERMSDERDRGKARQLLKLHRRHPSLIAFDSCLISLAWMRRLLLDSGCESPVIVATGANPQSRRKVAKLLAPGSKTRQLIVLCSDALSEGINLQKASAVVMLDMPSVIRVAEQRIGRVDRLNSPHARVEIWWPKDSPSFALKTDAKFIRRHRDVAAILGANIELPDSLLPREIMDAEAFSADELMDHLRQREASGEQWDGIRDAFEPVRGLIEGGQAIVAESTYEAIRTSQARVLSVIAVLRSPRPWAFFAIAGHDRGAPKWVYLDSPEAQPQTNLEDVAARLRDIAGTNPEPVDIRSERMCVARHLESFRTRLEASERLLLPRRKQRALAEMEYVIGQYLERAEPSRPEELQWLLEQLSPKSGETGIDLDAAAEAWMDLIRDPWFEELTRRRRTRPLRMRDLRRRLLARPIPEERILRAFRNLPPGQSLGHRTVVTILGLPES